MWLVGAGALGKRRGRSSARCSGRGALGSAGRACGGVGGGLVGLAGGAVFVRMWLIGPGALGKRRARSSARCSERGALVSADRACDEFDVGLVGLAGLVGPADLDLVAGVLLVQELGQGVRGLHG